MRTYSKEQYKKDQARLTRSLIQSLNTSFINKNSNLRFRVSKKYEWNKNSTDAIDVYYDVKDQFVDFENAHINLTDACYDYIITVAKVFFKMRKWSNIEIHFNNTGSVMWFHLPFDQIYQYYNT